MKTVFSSRFFCTSVLLCAASSAVHAQSSCSSDQQTPPSAVLERFISADCSDCWATPTLPTAAKGQSSLDWIVPSPRGDEAPLSAAATNDAAARLQILKLSFTAATGQQQASALLAGPPTQTASSLRVAHGLAVNGYMGASIEFKPSADLRRQALDPKKPSAISDSREIQAYLVLVETLPAGTEGSNVERNLVRNVLITPWDLNQQLSRPRQDGFKPLFESRPISLPQGVNPDRLRVLGWVQNAQGQILATAQSRCIS